MQTLSPLAKVSVGARALSEAKPLRWSFLLTFPIVMAAIWGVFLVLAHVERNQLVDELNVLLTDGSVDGGEGLAAANGPNARSARWNCSSRRPPHPRAKLHTKRNSRSANCCESGNAN